MKGIRKGLNWAASLIPGLGQATNNAAQPLTAAPASSAVPRAGGGTQNNNATVSAEEIAKKTAEAVERSTKRALKEVAEQGDSYVMY